MREYNIQDLLCSYASGLTVAQTGQRHGISCGKTYQLLKEAGCEFRRAGVPKGYKHSEDFCRKLSLRMKGRVFPPSFGKKVSEAKRSKYNGINGYGHTKNLKNGYVLAYAPCHPHAHADGYVLLHKVIMEQHLGRYLNEEEVVHHINHVRDDNSIENLKLMNRREHASMHMKERHAKRSDRY